MKKIEVGQLVTVYNQTLDGAPIVEGDATVKEILEDMGNGFFACRVEFVTQPSELFFRWIDADEQ